MSLRDYSNVPDELCPAWLVASRKRQRYLNSKEHQDWLAKEWERIKNTTDDGRKIGDGISIFRKNPPLE